MTQDRLTAVKNFIDVAIPVGFGSAMAGNAMSATFSCALDFVMENINPDRIGDDMYQRIYDAADFLTTHHQAAGTLWGLACAAIIYTSVRRAQKQMANEMAFFQLEQDIRQALAADFPQQKKPGLLARIFA